MNIFRYLALNGGSPDRSGSKSTHKLTLAEVPVGSDVCVSGFVPGLSSGQRLQLQTFGLLEGHCVHVVQHSPVTIIQIEHIELALENGLARQVFVELL
jgi:Fe2+ transport system protein FeoA